MQIYDCIFLIFLDKSFFYLCFCKKILHSFRSLQTNNKKISCKSELLVNLFAFLRFLL